MQNVKCKMQNYNSKVKNKSMVKRLVVNYENRQPNTEHRSGEFIGILLSILLTAIILPSTLYAKDILELKSYAEVASDKIFLSDISKSPEKLPFKNIEIGRAALPGKSRIISKNYIKIRLKQNKKNIELIGDKQVKVHTKFRRITRDDLINITREYVLSNYENKKVELKITNVPKEIITPYGNIEMKLVSSQNKPTTRKSTRFVTIPVNIYVNNTIFRTIRVNVALEIFQNVPIAKRNILKGEKIKETDLYFKVLNLTNLPKDILFEIAEDKIAKQTILKGSVIRKSYLTERPNCQRNDVITIVARLGNLEVKTIGKALQSGRLGDVIKVLNLQTKKKLYAKIIDDKKAKVIIK